jgi:hypothetical protein
VARLIADTFNSLAIQCGDMHLRKESQSLAMPTSQK